MDILFPYEDLYRLTFKDSATQIGFEDLSADCTLNVHLLQPHDRLTILLMAWKKIGDYLTHNQYIPSVGNVVSLVGRYTLDLWFGRDWIKCSNENKTSLIEHMMKVYPTAYITMPPFSWPYMFSIYRDPWVVEYLNTNFQRMSGPPIMPVVLEPADSEYIQREGILLIIHRMINMFDFNMLKLVKHLCLRLILAWQDPTSVANRSIHATPNAEQYIDCVAHIYLIALYELNGVKDVHVVLECIERYEFCEPIEPESIERDAKHLYKALKASQKPVTEFLNAFLLKIPDQQFINSFGTALSRYAMFLTGYRLRKLNYVNPLLLPHEEVYKKLVQLFIKQRESSEDMMKMTPRVSERMFSRAHNLKALKFSYELINPRPRGEWYTTKLTILLAIICEENNSLEECKYNDVQAVDGIIAKEQELATFYSELAKLLSRCPYLEQEAWLTTFSLHPCKEHMDAVTKCGSRNLRAMKKTALRFKPVFDPPPMMEIKSNIPVAMESSLVKPMSPKMEIQSEDQISILDKKETTLVEAKSPGLTAYDCERPTTSAAFLASLAIQNKEIKPTAAVSIESPQTQTKLKQNITAKPKRGPRKKNTEKKPAEPGVKAGRGRPIGSTKTAEKKIGQIIKPKNKPLIAKPDGKDKDSAEVIYSAAAGAADNLASATAESMKYPAFALMNSVTDTEDLMRYTNYDSNIQYDELNRILSNLRLQKTNYDDILSLLVAPRYKRLTWSVCWKTLKKRCRELLTKDKRKQQLVQQYMADANDRLTHLNIDYEKYKDKPQIDYGSIEGGYECFDVDSGDEGLKPVIIKPKLPRGRPPKKPVQESKLLPVMEIDEVEHSRDDKPSTSGSSKIQCERMTNTKQNLPVEVISQETIYPGQGGVSTSLNFGETFVAKLSEPLYLNQPLYIVRRQPESSFDCQVSPTVSTTTSTAMDIPSNIAPQGGQTSSNDLNVLPSTSTSNLTEIATTSHVTEQGAHPVEVYSGFIDLPSALNAPIIPRTSTVAELAAQDSNIVDQSIMTDLTFIARPNIIPTPQEVESPEVRSVASELQSVPTPVTGPPKENKLPSFASIAKQGVTSDSVLTTMPLATTSNVNMPLDCTTILESGSSASEVPEQDKAPHVSTQDGSSLDASNKFT